MQKIMDARCGGGPSAGVEAATQVTEVLPSQDLVDAKRFRSIESAAMNYCGICEGILKQLITDFEAGNVDGIEFEHRLTLYRQSYDTFGSLFSAISQTAPHEGDVASKRIHLLLDIYLYSEEKVPEQEYDHEGNETKPAWLQDDMEPFVGYLRRHLGLNSQAVATESTDTY